MADRQLVRYRVPVHDSDRWRGFALRPGDIVISTPAKCGTTWMQMICALLVLPDPVLQQPLSRLSPWLDYLGRARRDVVADLEAQTHRRFIKTHTPLDGLPLDPTITYICVGRDPRDAALSMLGHQDNMDFAHFLADRADAAAIDGVEPGPVNQPPPTGSERERFWRWVDNDAPPAEIGSSLRRMLHHIETFQEAAGIDVVMLHFEDLRRDLEGQMRGLADRLAISVPESRWPEVVQAAGFEAMRSRAHMTAPNAQLGHWLDTAHFFKRGTSGQWRDVLDDDDLERYRVRAGAIGSPGVIDWLHGGPP
ncbi:MAG: sulfotransferase domain-containing protein [Pseudonocardiales bacterium]